MTSPGQPAADSPPTCDPCDEAGLFIAVFHLDAGDRFTVGKLGRFDLPAGTYLYVGSAQRNRSARLARHGRRRKPLRWHIDYLSVRARMLGAILLPGGRDDECRLAGELADLYPRPIARFGASDCRCGGHLFLAGDLLQTR
jgi:sugar fermentation stimulation protein A